MAVQSFAHIHHMWLRTPHREKSGARGRKRERELEKCRSVDASEEAEKKRKRNNRKEGLTCLIALFAACQHGLIDWWADWQSLTITTGPQSRLNPCSRGVVRTAATTLFARHFVPDCRSSFIPGHNPREGEGMTKDHAQRRKKFPFDDTLVLEALIYACMYKVNGATWNDE